MHENEENRIPKNELLNRTDLDEINKIITASILRIIMKIKNIV